MKKRQQNQNDKNLGSNLQTENEKCAHPLRIAVTGGSGRIGSQVVKQLVARGHFVLNLDRREAREPLAKFVYIDLRRREQVQPVLETVDAVCHLGEVPNAEGSLSPDAVYAHNTAAGACVLQTAADLKLKRAIYTSTAQVYGFWGGPLVPPVRLPMDETHPLLPQNVYSLSKVANEHYAQLCASRYNLSVAIFRFPGVMDWKLDESGENWMWPWLEKQNGHGEGCHTYVHVTDAARAFVLAVENPRPGCEAYHFTADEVASGIPLRQRLAKNAGDYPALPKDWPAYKSPVITDKAREHFGWRPAWNLLDFYRKKFGREPHEKA